MATDNPPRGTILTPSVTCFAIAQSLSHASDAQQAEILNEFHHLLRFACHNDHDLEMQLCHVANLLDKDGEALVETLYEFIKLNRGDDNHPLPPKEPEPPKTRIIREDNQTRR